MTLQMLEYFVALAEKGSFTDAAAACFVTQPALSRAIATLEQELGCVLVDRDKRKNASQGAFLFRNRIPYKST